MRVHYLDVGGIRRRRQPIANEDPLSDRDKLPLFNRHFGDERVRVECQTEFAKCFARLTAHPFPIDRQELRLWIAPEKHVLGDRYVGQKGQFLKDGRNVKIESGAGIDEADLVAAFELLCFVFPPVMGHVCSHSLPIYLREDGLKDCTGYCSARRSCPTRGTPIRPKAGLT